MEELILKIEQWAEDRNLIHGSTFSKQLLKLIEEAGELASGISKGKLEVIKDSVGDCFVVLTILANQNGFSLLRIKATEQKYSSMDRAGYFLSNAIRDVSCSYLNKELALESFIGLLDFFAKQYDLSLKECVQAAYDEIKDRKGVMREGVWIKSEDL